MEKNITIKRDGLNLAAKISVPDNDKFNLAILAYGFVGSMDPAVNDLLPVLAEKLQAKGLATLRFDFNGHGQSDGPLDNMSIYNELEDYHAVLEYALKLDGVDKIYLIGHSQGGVVSSMMAGFYKDKIDKLVIMSSAATLVEDAKMGVCWDQTYDPDHVPAKVDFGKFKLNDWYFRTAKFINMYEVAHEYQGPTLILHGEKDQAVNNFASVRYHSVMKNSEFHLIPDSDHGLHTNRDMVYNYVVDFLTK